MLSHDERRQLERLSEWTAVADPGFAAGLRSGCPRPPQEYRRWPAGLLLGTALMLILLALVTGSWLPVAAAAITVPVGCVFWRSRRLDHAPRPPRPRRHCD